MTKQEFLLRLEAGLSGLTESDAQERLTFYSEMIDDRMEDGLSEEDAVSQIGDVETIVASILAEIPKKAPENLITHVEKPTHKQEAPKKEQKKRMSARQIVLLCLGAPLWLPLLIAALAVLLALLAVLWSLIVSAWAVFGALAGTALGCLIGGPVYFIFTSPAGGNALVGVGLVCAGLAILAFHGAVAATRGCAWLTKTVCVAVVKFIFERRQTA